MAASVAICNFATIKHFEPVPFDPERVYRRFVEHGVKPMLTRASGDRFMFQTVEDESALSRVEKAGLIDRVRENRAAFADYLRAHGRAVTG